jgi:hypothetical protein
MNCAIKLFKRDLIQQVPLVSNGGIISFEVLYRLLESFPKIRLKQFPVKHSPRTTGRSTGGTVRVIFKIIIEGARIVFSK